MLQGLGVDCLRCVDVKDQTVSNRYESARDAELKKCDHKTELAVCKALARNGSVRKLLQQLEEDSVVRISHASMPPPRGTRLHLETREAWSITYNCVLAAKDCTFGCSRPRIDTNRAYRKKPASLVQQTRYTAL